MAEHKWRGRDDVGYRLDLVGQTVIVRHVLFHSFLDDDMCGRAENLALNVFSKPVMMPTVPISAATPSVIPATDTKVFSEIVRLRRLARR
ncbi:MAG: hypothetical protein P0120_05885 [Nitrospira sp.]|nr:hypothetical protein [Nitrospira sp.]